MNLYRCYPIVRCVVAVSAVACSEAATSSQGGTGGALGAPPEVTGGSASTTRSSTATGGTRPNGGARGTGIGGNSSHESTVNTGGAATRERGGSSNSDGGTTQGVSSAVTGGASTFGGRTAIGGTAGSVSGNKNNGGSATGGTKARGGASAAGATSAGRGGASVTGGNGASGSTGAPVTIGVRISGRQLLVNGKPFRIRGVCWNPVPKGKNHPDGLDYPGLAPKDIPLMKAANINVVRTYEPLTNTAVLDQLADAGLYVLNSVYPYGGSPANDVTARVNAVKNHRAILMWVIGNEWNYNGLYVDMSAAESQARLNEVATLIRAADPNHPIASVYGELPPKSVVDAMPNIDTWGVNVYSGITFGDRFSNWTGISGKPIFVAEYGADAFNATKAAYDPESQAKATDALTHELSAQCSDTNPSGVALGGTIFEWADEWWKASGGDVNAHDNGGVAPGGGPYPDSTFNEEWWGIVDIDRSPRPAYDALRAAYGDG